jgi:hypothetical protein
MTQNTSHLRFGLLALLSCILALAGNRTNRRRAKRRGRVLIDVRPLWAVDAYNVQLPLSEAILDRLGVNHLLLVDENPSAGPLQGFVSRGQQNGIRLYTKRADEPIGSP